jgi:hypothetical protein
VDRILAVRAECLDNSISPRLGWLRNGHHVIATKQVLIYPLNDSNRYLSSASGEWACNVALEPHYNATPILVNCLCSCNSMLLNVPQLRCQAFMHLLPVAWSLSWLVLFRAYDGDPLNIGPVCPGKDRKDIVNGFGPVALFLNDLLNDRY